MKKVLIIGDSILDKYIYGDVVRISPEAPVPVFDYLSEEYRLGGAMNVAANIRTLWGGQEALEIHYFGYYDNRCKNSLSEYEVLPYGHFLNAYSEQKILEKTRFVSGTNQLMRLDNKKEYDHCVLCKVNINFSQYNLVVVSDYNKNTLCHECYCDIHKGDVPTIIECKTGMWKYGLSERLKSLIIFKCNLKEFKNNFLEKDKTSVSEAIITLGKDGFHMLKKNVKMPSCKKESDVVDVVGAGDTFLAGMAVNFLETDSWDPGPMALFGNRAAGVKVSQFGTRAVKRDNVNKI